VHSTSDWWHNLQASNKLEEEQIKNLLLLRPIKSTLVWTIAKMTDKKFKKSKK
jgi:hypothetical protein